MESVSKLRERLLQSPEDWEVRLALGALLRDEQPREAALLVATAPNDPETPDQAVQAAALVHHLDDELSLKLTDRALAQDSGHVESLVLRALIYQERGDAPKAKRSAAVAAMIDPDRLAEETELLQWLADQGQQVPGMKAVVPSAMAEGAAAETFVRRTNPVIARPEEEARMVLPEEPEEVATLIVQIDDEEEEEPLPVIHEEALAEPDEAEETPEAAANTMTTAEDAPVRATAPMEEARVPTPEPKPSKKKSKAKKAAASPVDAKAKEAAVAKSDGEQATSETEGEKENHGEDPVSPLARSGDAAPIPAQRRMTAQKASAITVALVVHAFLILMLGVLSVIVPEPKVSELVGIVAPEAQQETPQTKKIVPTSMPNPSVSVSPARFLNAVGVSQVSLPTFEASTADPLATDIATTDVGASFAMPFAGKGTSQVNFFGIKSAGKRVAFLIDAEKYMLTDQRGGYPAYQIVKEEIAGMIGKMGLETRFNVVLFEENNLSAFSDKLLPATAANKGKVSEWLEPVNREYEKLGLRAIKYPILPVKSEVEPVKTNYLRGYLRAIQYALEQDVDTVFLICSGYRGMWVPRDPEEYAKLLKKMRWTEKDDIALAEANKKASEWLKNENARRKEKGIPERVVISLAEIRNELGLRPRTKPGGIQITAEEREDQVANAMKLHYLSKDKPKPQINFVIFIGADADDRNVPQMDHFKNLARRAKAGKVRVLKGLGALKNVTGRK